MFSTASFAEEKPALDLDDPRPLILQPGYNGNTDFSDEQTSDAFKTNGRTGDELTDYCSALRTEADTLKRQRKPQQHWAAMERYKYECQAVFDRPAEKVR
jgi:hypothetical protein